MCMGLDRSYNIRKSICLMERFMQHGVGIKDKVLLEPHHFLPRQSSFWRKTNNFCCCQPKTHVYMVVYCQYTIRTSILVHYQGSQSLGWESYIDLYSNLTVFYQTTPFWRKIDQLCGWSGPNHMCSQVYTGVILFQSQ